MKKTKAPTRNLIIRRRRMGKSYNQILDELQARGTPVAKSTVSLICNSIKLTAKEKKKLAANLATRRPSPPKTRDAKRRLKAGNTRGGFVTASLPKKPRTPEQKEAFMRQASLVYRGWEHQVRKAIADFLCVKETAVRKEYKAGKVFAYCTNSYVCGFTKDRASGSSYLVNRFKALATVGDKRKKLVFLPNRKSSRHIKKLLELGVVVYHPRVIGVDVEALQKIDGRRQIRSP